MRAPIWVTESQLRELLALVEPHVSAAAAAAGRDALAGALASQVDSADDVAGGEEGTVPAEGRSGRRSGGEAVRPVFPRGRRITSDNFTGAVWVSWLVTDGEVFGARIGNVTFEPGARTNWHSHPGGQILLVTDGVGYYQEHGGPIQLLRRGDVVEIGPGVVHWHGATPSSELTHVGVVTNALQGNTVWLQPVTDKEYHRFW